MKLRSHLVILVVAALLPVLIFAGVMIFVSAQRQRDGVDRGLLDTARALSLAVDRELETSIAALRTFALAPYFDSKDLNIYIDLDSLP